MDQARRALAGLGKPGHLDHALGGSEQPLGTLRLLMVRASLCVIVMACTGASAPGADPGAQDTVPRNGASYVPDTTWRTARASQVGLDSVRLAALGQRLQSGAIPDISSLLIVREGYLVLERYFNGSGRDDVHTMQSVSKSVTSLVTASRPIRELDPQSLISMCARLRRSRDVRSAQASDLAAALLEMQPASTSNESPYGIPVRAAEQLRRDLVRVALEPAMNALPVSAGSTIVVGVITIAAAVRRLTGVQFDDFARTHLFRPIGITTERLSKSPYDGLAHSAAAILCARLTLPRRLPLCCAMGLGSDTIDIVAWPPRRAGTGHVRCCEFRWASYRLWASLVALFHRCDRLLCQSAGCDLQRHRQSESVVVRHTAI